MESSLKVLLPLFLILSTTKHLFENLRYVKEHEWTPVPNDRVIDMPEFFRFIGMEEITEKEKKYLPKNPLQDPILTTR